MNYIVKIHSNTKIVIVATPADMYADLKINAFNLL